MATSVIIRDLGGYAAPPAPLAQRESNSFGSSGEYYMVMSSGEQEQICAAVKAPTLEEKLAFYQARKERKKQQRQQKTSYASEKRRMFNREMEKTYTEQQAMEELFANPPYKEILVKQLGELYVQPVFGEFCCARAGCSGGLFWLQVRRGEV